MNPRTDTLWLFALAASVTIAGVSGGYLIETYPTRTRGAHIEAETMTGHLYIAGAGADCRAAWAAARTEPGTRRVICVQGDE